tara:strand:- start:1948 stop:3195 length:1248 start_codon:yes stop_codon:yes gene_type:complete
MKKNIYFYTQGCRLNQSETASIETGFNSLGYTRVFSYLDADIALINTCTVTENADTDTKKLTKKMAKENTSIKIALIGCQSQIHQDKLFELPNVQWVIGNQDKMKAHHIIDQQLALKKPVMQTPKLTRDPFTIPAASIDSTHTRATIKIQDGCDFYCAFCIIPFARGPARSRVFEDIMNECNQLAAYGYQEIVITGINIGTYEYESKTIVDVVTAISDIETIKRIRISSIEPTTIATELIELMNTNPKLCRYLHIPLQSGSDEILAAMARKYSMKEFRSFVEFAYKTVDDICIGTDVIVGFPGETKAHFDETVANLLTLPIHYFHVFSYSERKFARSRKKENKIPAQTIANRSKILRTISQQKKDAFYKSQKGKQLNILVESFKNGSWSGLTDNYIKVNFKSTENLKNKFHTITY